MTRKKAAGLTLIVLFFLSVFFSLTPRQHQSWASQPRPVAVALLAGDTASEQGRLILACYEQVLREEGFPYRVISEQDLIGYGGGGLDEYFDALIVPEYINSAMSPEAAEVIGAYATRHGGKVLLAFDPGTVMPAGGLRPEPLLAGLAGVRYFQPAGGQNPAYAGYWVFPSAEEALKWGITPGKLDRDNAVSSYSYGKIKFEHAGAVNMDARVVAGDPARGVETPVITEKRYAGDGAVVYANLPLGKYKLRSDDLTLRSVLRTFLIQYAHIPRLVNSPGGKGGMVFNLHICSGAYFRALTVMLMQGLFQSDLPMSIHVTAGPDTYKFGDGMGFFAENELRGKPVLEVLQNYGEIGSHGGWAHNFFAYNLQYLTRDRAYQLIDWNNAAIEAVTGKKVVEYSAPGGNHPFWVNTGLEERGVKAYYYAGDTGSPPTHPRLNDQYAGDKMWAFPITPFREYASLEEMERGGVKPGEVREWMENLVDFTIREKSIRMIYTHPSDTRFCLEAMKAFEEKVLAEQKKDRLVVAPMAYFADFLNRSAKTVFRVSRQDDNNYVIDLENPDGLKDITVAVYTGDEGRVVAGGNVDVLYEQGWLYLTVTSNQTSKHLEVNRA
ncbi:MAG: hypothetical protein K6T80_03535 [Firmicutes bacterium]|nr:hypothetical protein [Bacillota bacterium]